MTERPEARPLRLSVIVPAYGASPHLLDCLRALMAQSRPADEVIVFHSGPDDPTGAVAQVAPAVRCVHRRSRAFAGEARNLGAAQASGDWLVFLDCDMIAAPDWLAAHEAAILAGNGAPFVQVGSIGCGPSGGPWARAMWFLECGVVLPHRRSRELAAANGANFAVPTAAFRSTGGFRADLANGEDVDLMCALRDAGLSIRFEPHARADHQFEGGRAHTLQRAHTLGKAAATLRRTHPLPGALAVRYPALALTLPFARLGQMTWRLVTERGPFLQFLLYLPFTFALLVAWTAGFRDEARDTQAPAMARA